MDAHSIFSIHKKAGPFVNGGSRCAPRIFVRRAQKNTLSDPTSTVGSAEASSFGPRPAQSVFCDVHAAAKTDWIFFAAPEPRILRLLDKYKMRGHPSDALSFYIHAAIGKISFKTPKITAEIAAASRKPWQMRRLFAANLASSCSF